jgi:hypothetical protein
VVQPQTPLPGTVASLRRAVPQNGSGAATRQVETGTITGKTAGEGATRPEHTQKGAEGHAEQHEGGIAGQELTDGLSSNIKHTLYPLNTTETLANKITTQILSVCKDP